MTVTSFSAELRLNNVLSKWLAVIGGITFLGLAAFYSKEDKVVSAEVDHKGLKFHQRPHGSEERARFIPGDVPVDVEIGGQALLTLSL